jgi:hypothetical protein
MQLLKLENVIYSFYKCFKQHYDEQLMIDEKINKTLYKEQFAYNNTHITNNTI